MELIQASETTEINGRLGKHEDDIVQCCRDIRVLGLCQRNLRQEFVMRPQTIYAVEVSGVCNLRCGYCPYHKGGRKRGFMDTQTLERICNLIHSGRVGYTRPMHLHLFGEPMLHPSFLAFALRFKVEGIPISFSTNGHGITFEVARDLARVGFEYITVSPHEPKTALRAAYILRAANNTVVVHEGPDHSWAGQVGEGSKWKGWCEFLQYGEVVVRWIGDVATCCISDTGAGVIGNIQDSPDLWDDAERFSLCRTCHLNGERSDGEGVQLDGEAMSIDTKGLPGVERRMYGL